MCVLPLRSVRLETICCPKACYRLDSWVPNSKMLESRSCSGGEPDSILACTFMSMPMELLFALPGALSWAKDIMRSKSRLMVMEGDTPLSRRLRRGLRAALPAEDG